MFNAIAFRYDLLNHLLSLGIDRRWRRRVVQRVVAQLAPQGEGAVLLDLATGTADLALALACALPKARLKGVDLSAQMLAVGAEKVLQAGLRERITLCEGDAEHLADPTGSYDAVTVAFGVRNFEALEQGMAEVFRVLKPGGTLYVLEFGVPHNRLFGTVYRFYFHRILPKIGRWLSRESHAYTYLPASVDAFPSGDGFTAILSRSGFAHTTTTHLMGGVAQIYQASKPLNQ